MKKNNSSERLFSFFPPPVTSTVPSREITLQEIYSIIASGHLKSQTEKVRANPSLKTRILPFVTFSGTFNKRNFAGLKQYSSFIVIDLDNCDMALKEIISADKQFPPSLLFTSPLGLGLKIVYSIANASVDLHFDLFRAISFYLSEVYNAIPDKSGSDITRICLIPSDIDCYYSPSASIDSAKLLDYFPPDKTIPPSQTNTGAPQFGKSTSTYGELLSTRLNKMPEIHALAVSALKRNGWQQKGKDLWTRPGKDVKDGCSAKRNVWDQAGIYIFTCFTSSAAPFKAHTGYSDIQILCLLNYSDDWTACITDLASRYLEPV